MHPTVLTNLTTFLAVWGAILSSITFGWTLYRDLRDRAKIKLAAEVRKIGKRTDGALFTIDPKMTGIEASAEPYIVVSVVNVGRRRMRWKSLGGYYRRPVNGRRGFSVSARFLPKTLEEQEALDEFFEITEEFRNGNVKSLVISDVAGRKWSVPRRDMKKLVADAKKYTVLAGTLINTPPGN